MIKDQASHPYTSLNSGNYMYHNIKNICTLSIQSTYALPIITTIYRSFATTMSQLKISDFSGEMFKGFEVLYISMSATATKLLSSSQFYKLLYDTILVKSASASVSFFNNNGRNPEKNTFNNTKV